VRNADIKAGPWHCGEPICPARCAWLMEVMPTPAAGASPGRCCGVCVVDMVGGLCAATLRRGSRRWLEDIAAPALGLRHRHRVCHFLVPDVCDGRCRMCVFGQPAQQARMWGGASTRGVGTRMACQGRVSLCSAEWLMRWDGGQRALFSSPFDACCGLRSAT